MKGSALAGAGEGLCFCCLCVVTGSEWPNMLNGSLSSTTGLGWRAGFFLSAVIRQCTFFGESLACQVVTGSLPVFGEGVGTLINLHDFLEQIRSEREQFALAGHFELLLERLELALHLVEVAQHGLQDLLVSLFVDDRVGQFDVFQHHQQVSVQLLLLLVEVAQVQVVVREGLHFPGPGSRPDILVRVVDRQSPLPLHGRLGGLVLAGAVGGEVDALGLDHFVVPLEVGQQVLLVLEPELPELDEPQCEVCGYAPNYS